MWRLLYPFRTGGFHFRKQAALGPYVIDFVCHHSGLVIEVDGGQHYAAAGRAADAMRDAYLNERGYRVLRFSNLDVLTNPGAVYASVSEQLRADVPRIRKAGQ